MIKWWDRWWIAVRSVLPAIIAALVALGLSLAFHWGLWKWWVQRYDISPQEELANELAFAASLVSFLTLALAVGFGWFAIHEFQQARKRDVLELICSDSGTGRDATLRVDGEDDFFELNVFVRNNGDSIASVFGFVIDLPFLAEAEKFDQRQPEWGPKGSAQHFGSKVVSTSSISALGRNIQLRKRGSLFSIQFTNSHDIAVFPHQTLLLFSITIPAEAFEATNGSAPTHTCKYTLYSLNGEPEDGEWNVTLICTENTARSIGQNRELRKYPKLQPRFSVPVIDRTSDPLGDDEPNLEACVIGMSLENVGSVPAEDYAVHISLPFLEYVWNRFRERYGLSGGQADRTLMFKMMKEPTGGRAELFQFFDDSTLDPETTLALQFSSHSRVPVAPGSREALVRFEIPTSLIPSTYGFICHYAVEFKDGKQRTGEVSMSLANDKRYASGGDCQDT